MSGCVAYSIRDWFALGAALVLASAAGAEEAQRDWQRSPSFPELSFTAAVEPQLRIHVNAPLEEAGDDRRPTRLVIFTLPNGNTIEQTLGCKLAEGMDWHYDIQHVAAQTRLLRTLLPNERIVLLLAEANGLSWPTWRRTVPDANATIGGLVDEWRREFGGDEARVTLTGHSGGGSFKFGLIESAEQIPAYIDRIVFLDSNYNFDGPTHAAKFADWLRGDEARRLVVLAYDDREITFNGKKVVGPTGGTYRATGRMRDALGPLFPLTESERPPFQESDGLAGRIRFYVHPNPQNKILHTALVGEMNGLVHALTLGTPAEGTWGTFGGPRAFTKWVQPEPTPRDDAPSKSAPPPSTEPLPTKRQSQLPPRPANAIGGAAFIESIEGADLAEREAAIRREIAAGNFPEFLREFKVVKLSVPSTDGKEATATIEVMPDYLAIGSDADFVRMPMTPQTAQALTDQFGCVLPTRKLVDAIDAAGEVHLAPRPMTEAREAPATFLEHHRIIEQQRGDRPLGPLVTGIKKDIVLSPRIFERPRRLAIYGWRQLDGKPIQPLTIVHWDGYVDYSHGARLVNRRLQLDGQELDILELLTDKERAALVSDEGPMHPPRYPDRE